MRRRATLETGRANYMNPTNLGKHFARLINFYMEYSIESPSQNFKMDESGFRTRKASRGNAKAAMRRDGRINYIYLDWSHSADNVTVMPFVPVDGRAWTPLAVLPGVRTKYRT